MLALCLNRIMTNEELSQQIAALTTTVTEKFDRIDTRFEQIDKRFEDIDGRLNTLQAGQNDLHAKYNDLVTKYDDLKAGQDDLATKYDDLKAGQDDLATKYDNLKAGQDNLVAKHADLQVGLDDLRTKYSEMNEKQGHIVNAQQTIAKTQDELQRALEEHGAKLEEDFTDMKATQASIQHDISRINRKMIIEAGVRDTMHESVFSTQDSHYRDLDRRLRLVEAHFPELGQQGA